MSKDMLIEHFGGRVAIGNGAQLEEVLTIRYGEDVNEYWLSNERRYPALAIQVRGSDSCLHFFPAEDHPGFISQGDHEKDCVVQFATNTPFELIEVPMGAVIPFKDALQAAQEFFARPSIPPSVQWLEL